MRCPDCDKRLRGTLVCIDCSMTEQEVADLIEEQRKNLPYWWPAEGEQDDDE